MGYHPTSHGSQQILHHTAKLRKEIELYQILPDKRAYGFLTESEVIEKILDKLSSIPNTKLKYNLKKCSICTIVGDPTFITKQSHTRQKKFHVHNPRPRKSWWGMATVPPMRKHSSNTRLGHTGECRSFKVSKDTIYDDLNRAPGAAKVFYAHPGVHLVRLFQSNTKTVHRWSCCGNDPNHGGCKTYCNQCNQIVGESTGCIKLCNKCRQDVDKTEGCMTCCEKCERVWGEAECS